MSSIGTLWTYPSNPRAMKIEAAAAMNGRTITYAPDFTMGVTNKTASFLANFPLGRVPTFKSVEEGIALFESDAIAQYAAESGPAAAQLLGAAPAERAVIRQWIGFADHELFEPLTTLVLWRYGMAPFDEKAETTALRRLKVLLAVLEGRLQGREYVATEQLSLADLSVVAGLYWGFTLVVDAEMRAEFKRTTAWYLRVIHDERVGGAFGEGDFVKVRKDRP